MVSLVLVLASPGAARVPREINYQGKLTDGQGQPLAGSHSVVFAIYDALAGGTQLWSEARTVNSDSTGVFAVVLGASTPIEVAFTGDAWLQVEVDGKALSPRRPMVSVPYAFNAEAVNGIGASATPAPNSLYPLGPDAKIAPAVLPSGLPPLAHASTHGSGGSDQIAVTSDLIVDGTIATADLSDNSVTLGKLLPNVVSSIEGVTNDGGNVDLLPQNAITITGDDAANNITIGESHSARTDNPHGTTAAQTGALVSVEGVSNAGGNIDLVPGSNITISGDNSAKSITIAATGVGDITEVDAGAGLAGGGTSGSVTLSLAVPLQLSDSSSAGVVAGTNAGSGAGLEGTGAAVGVSGNSAAGKGIFGTSTTGSGVYGETSQDDPNIGASVVGHKLSNGNAVMGLKDGNVGHAVYGSNIGISGCGVAGWSREYVGTWGESYHDNGLCGVTDRPDNNYGIYTPDNVMALNYQTTGALMQVAQNAGSEPLEPGDVACFVGITADLGTGGPPMIQVARSAGAATTAVAGVVYSRFNIKVITGKRESDGKDSVSGMEVTPAGQVQPGDYLLLVTYGPARVKASALASPIRPGDLLASASEAGYAASLAKPGLGGAAGAAGAAGLELGALIGKALEPLSSGEEMIYVFVTLQ